MRRLQMVALALLVGTPAVWAAIRHVRAREANGLLRSVATAHERVSYAGVVEWRRQMDKSSESRLPSTGPSGKKKHSWSGRKKSMSVRHNAATGVTAYRFGKWREFVMPRPSSRLQDPGGFCLAADALVANYRAEEQAPREFLGRKVRVIRVRPRIEGRPSLEIWADAQTDLPLKVTTFRADGSVYRTSQYSKIEFEAQDVSEKKLQRTHRWFGTRVPLDDPRDSAGFKPLLPDYLPKGFRLVEARIRQKVTPQLTLLYSDGATFFQIVQSPAATPAMEENHLRRLYGERKARGFMNWKFRRAMKRLAESGAESAAGGDAGTIVCRKRESRSHMTFKMGVEDLDVELAGRRDLEPESMLAVLRSLKR